MIIKKKTCLVAALTYNRPEGLRDLLGAWEYLTIPDDVAVTFLIVDNSPDANGRETVSMFQTRFEAPLLYLHARERGLSAARNVALNYGCDKNFDYLAFMDDDEVPVRNWLSALFDTHRTTQTEIVVGAVHATLASAAPKWAKSAKGLWEVDQFVNGATLKDAATSNVLFSLMRAKTRGIRFDERFSLTGGEDTFFFDQMRRDGAHIVYSAKAVVTEVIVAQRATFPWLWRRWLRTGITNTQIKLIHNNALTNKLVQILGGFARISVGVVMFLLTSPLLLVGKFKTPLLKLRLIARGCGVIGAVLGMSVQEYKSIKR